MFTMFQAPAFKGRWIRCRGQRPWRTCVHALPRCDAARTLVAAAARWWRPSAAERGGAGQRDAAVRGCHAAMQLGLGAVRNVLTRLGSPHRALSLLARAPEALVQAGVWVEHPVGPDLPHFGAAIAHSGSNVTQRRRARVVVTWWIRVLRCWDGHRPLGRTPTFYC